MLKTEFMPQVKWVLNIPIYPKETPDNIIVVKPFSDRYNEVNGFLFPYETAT